jgi:hypothetical protein
MEMDAPEPPRECQDLFSEFFLRNFLAEDRLGKSLIPNGLSEFSFLRRFRIPLFAALNI